MILVAVALDSRSSSLRKNIFSAAVLPLSSTAHSGKSGHKSSPRGAHLSFCTCERRALRCEAVELTRIRALRVNGLLSPALSSSGSSGGEGRGEEAIFSQQGASWTRGPAFNLMQKLRCAPAARRPFVPLGTKGGMILMRKKSGAKLAPRRTEIEVLISVRVFLRRAYGLLRSFGS